MNYSCIRAVVAAASLSFLSFGCSDEEPSGEQQGSSGGRGATTGSVTTTSPDSSVDTSTGDSGQGQCDFAAEEMRVAAHCQQQQDCGCGEFATVEECVDANIGAVDALNELALEAGLELDCECSATRRETWASRECQPQHEFALSELFRCDRCDRWVGDALEGDPCERVDPALDMDNCAQGLACHQGVCVPACDAVELDPCGGCHRGFSCDETTAECVPLGREGDPCESGCDFGFVCDDAVGTCTLGLPAGAACQSDECRSGDCVAGVCEESNAVICGLSA